MLESAFIRIPLTLKNAQMSFHRKPALKQSNLSRRPGWRLCGLRTRFEYDNEIVLATSALRKERANSWEDVIDISYSHWASQYVLHLRDDNKVAAKSRPPGPGAIACTIWASVVIVVLAACSDSGGPTSPLTGHPSADTSYLLPPTTGRTWLTAEELLGPSLRADSPYHNDHFMPVGTWQEAQHEISGTLHLTGTSMKSSGPGTIDGQSVLAFPHVDLSFISHRGFLIPLNEDRQFDDQSNQFWGIILSPGRTWSESDDGNWSRASFPFVLVHRYHNQAHNGLASFLFDGQSISNLRIQIVQETAAWAREDFWGHLPVTFTSTQFPEEAVIKDHFDQRQADEVVIENWDALEALHGSTLPNFDANVSLADISASGLLMDGILYLSACPTRYGEYPYCRYMRHGAFSVTKSAAAALALLRLAEKFGPGVFDERIDTHLNVTSAHNGWTGVTFRDALNMATGIGDLSPNPESNDVFADENQAKMGRFVEMQSADDKLAVAFSYQNYSWGPAEKLRYNSTHTFVLSAAMDAYLKSREGVEASIADMLVNEIYRPIGIHVLPLSATIETDGTPGKPLLYVGLYPTLEDIARIADLLQSEGTHNGQQILHAESTAAALYRRAENGLIAGWWTNEVGANRYLLSFWSWPMSESGGCRVEIPTMSGFGGNIVSLLPNGVSVFRFADAHYYEPAPLVGVARQLGPSC